VIIYSRASQAGLAAARRRCKTVEASSKCR